MRVLIPDYIGAAGLAAVRALGRSGNDCEVAWSYGRLRKLIRSRFVNRTHHVDSYLTHPQEYGVQTLDLCRSRRPDVVMPLDLAAIAALLPLEQELSQVTSCLFPSDEGLRLGNDKLKTAEHCQRLGIATPRTVPVSDEDDMRAAALDLGYPLVLKPRSNLGGASGVFFVEHAETLRCTFESAVEACALVGAPILAQEFIPGYTHDVCAMAAEGDVVQIVTEVRKLMHPVTGGAGAVVFTTDSPPLANLARRYLESLNWTGPAQVEFRLDTRDGCFKLIELNPRFWGTLDVSIRAGINFPAIYCDLAVGRAITRNQSYRAGVRYVYLCSRAFRAYVQLMRRSGLRALRDPQHYRGRLIDFDLNDPVPDLYRVLLTLRRFAGKSDAMSGNSPAALINPLNCVLPHSYT